MFYLYYLCLIVAYSLTDIHFVLMVMQHLLLRRFDGRNQRLRLVVFDDNLLLYDAYCAIILSLFHIFAANGIELELRD